MLSRLDARSEHQVVFFFNLALKPNFFKISKKNIQWTIDVDHNKCLQFTNVDWKLSEDKWEMGLTLCTIIPNKFTNW